MQSYILPSAVELEGHVAYHLYAVKDLMNNRKHQHTQCVALQNLDELLLLL
ncbi:MULTISPECIES: hypothetical protein [unclassified Myroides]|uniref:hypothetical protein n=1 Tax=unclassified Myroides TaxID=2642485 RepID=UPI003D2F8695